MIDKKQKFFLIAGESSGDIHAAQMVTAYKKKEPDAEFTCIGGPALEAVGANILIPNSKLAVVGLFEIITHSKEIISAYKQVVKWLRVHRPTALVLVDYPEFNMLIASQAKRLGIPVFYYISPQIWAWRQGRARKIRRLVDKMAVILPFEKEFYRRYGMDVEFVGHPLKDEVRVETHRDQYLTEIGCSPEEVTVSLLPGSRSGEVKRHLKMMLHAALIIKSKLGTACHFIIPQAPGLPVGIKRFMEEEVREAGLFSGPNTIITIGNAHNVLAASHLSILASGTVALEAAILSTPMLVTYRLSPLTYHLGKRLIKVKWASLVNLIAQHEVVPELLQNDAEPEKIAATALDYLKYPKKINDMKAGLREVTELLGPPGASARAAELLRTFTQSRF